jgi:hypothetical protein
VEMGKTESDFGHAMGIKMKKNETTDGRVSDFFLKNRFYSD